MLTNKNNQIIIQELTLQKIFTEEDLFPREVTSFEKRDYGFLFYNEQNKDSYDSNHALIYKNKISDIKFVLKEIIDFYTKKNITPNIYESIFDDEYFEQIKNELENFGFETFTETQRYMILKEENKIKPNPEIEIKKIDKWNDEYGKEIFEKSNESYGIEVLKKSLLNNNTIFFVAFYKNIPVGMTYAHITEEVCRVDYLLVSKEYRNMGIARTIINFFVEYCKENKITTCYLWPDGETAEKIYHEAGFRNVVTKKVGRASYKNLTNTK